MLNLMVDASNMCQLDCTYCYFGKKGCSLMNAKKVFEAVKKVVLAVGKKLELLSIHYMGGEPILGWKRILELNKKTKFFCEKKGIEFRWSMTSNLVGLTEGKKEFMLKEKAGIHCSIDGPKHVQNLNRPFSNGKGSFEIVDKHIGLALQITPNDTARVTVTPQSSHHLKEIAEYLFDKGFENIGLFPSFNMDWKEEDFAAWIKGIREASDVAMLKKKQISSVLHLKKREKPEFDFCGAGKGLWALDVKGFLYNCHRLTNYPEYALINAADSTAEEVKKAMIEKTLAPCNIQIPDKCKKCSALNYCSGGCWADNLCENNNVYLPESIACKFRQITHEALREYLDMPHMRIGGKDSIRMEICCILADWCILRDGHPKCDSCESCYASCQGCDLCYMCNGCQYVCVPRD